MNDIYMQRCLDLAIRGLGSVAPNPMVGCVIVHQDRIIGEGWHEEFGKAHAEINALKNVKDCTLLTDSTMYVSLEPCNHTGKTPPCTEAIIKSGIKKVVIGITDPFEKVNGSGIHTLQQNGIEVQYNILKDKCSFTNRRFLTYHLQKRPYIILKWAQSADGFIGRIGEKVKISNQYSQVLVHRWRSEEQSIMAGTNTVLNDDPHLNVRYWKGKDPVKIILDRNLILPDSLNVFRGLQPVHVFTTRQQSSSAQIIYHTVNDDHFLQDIFSRLYELQILSVLVEGGSKLLDSLIKNNLWDEARVFHSQQMLQSGIPAPEFIKEVSGSENIGSDQLYYYNR